MLIILDGYGLAAPSDSNAISLAKKPNLDRIFSEFDTKQLLASGDSVGLPDGQMGNSEVGHMNLGAGRIIRQSLSRINYSIKTGEFYKNEAIFSISYPKWSRHYRRWGLTRAQVYCNRDTI